MSKLQSLIDLRLEIVKESGKSSFLVFSDDEITMLIDASPKTLDELTALKGFPKGGKRVKAYGDRILDIMNSRPVRAINTSLSTTSLFG